MSAEHKIVVWSDDYTEQLLLVFTMDDDEMVRWSGRRSDELGTAFDEGGASIKTGMSVNSSPSQCSQHVSTHITASQQIYAHIFAHIWIYSQFYVATEAVCTCIYNISLRVCLWTKGLFWIRADMSTAHLGWRRFSTHGQIIMIRRNIFELVGLFGIFLSIFSASQFRLLVPTELIQRWRSLCCCNAFVCRVLTQWSRRNGGGFHFNFWETAPEHPLLFKHFLPPLQLFQAATSDLLEAKV